ncbi:hypothetical protein NBT05_15370 [Aquimarina sp. ERC-38]|uniref:hypothetical protein n=1 Tax=Aquimarina sp. ERC-38 TaxID=2949996 RepID=UPI0022476333|nr:hypothetical protein [Aquimarina sp. ERC-38]UZO80322.1 hypothetical protein NBT05_15370 [Aquimarina sp. ERC-38]
MQLSYPFLLRVLRLTTFFVFLGRAYQHIFWDAPHRSFFWDESLLQPFVENVFSISWQDYVTNLRVDGFIQSIIRGDGYLYLLAAICTLIIKEKQFRFIQIPILIGGISLFILAVLLTKEKFYHIAQFFEHSLQFGIPFVFLRMIKMGTIRSKDVLTLKILTAVTFAAHGLYALGVYPVPGYFIDMVIQILNLSESTSIQLLYVAGILDIVIAILIFVPKVAVYALGYAFIWGLLTALARIVSGFDVHFIGTSLHQSLYLTVYRLPHALVPLLLLYYQKSSIVTNQ